MNLSRAGKMIYMIEGLGFLVVICAVWFDEFFDLPHRLFGAPSNSVSFEEACFESSFVVVLAVVVVLLTRRMLKRIAQLEELLPICMFCKKIRKPNADPEQQDSWEPVERYIHHRTGTQFSHGFCPECGMKHYGDLLREP